MNQALYTQRDAIFRGGEFQFQWDVRQFWPGFVGIEGQYDIVRATFTDGTNVPRITAAAARRRRLLSRRAWFARVNILHAFSQNDIAVPARRRRPATTCSSGDQQHPDVPHHPIGIQQFTFGVVGNNLLNEDIRNHVSYTKDYVLMPGASVRAFANVKY